MAKSKGKTASQIVSESRQELVDQLIQKMKDGVSPVREMWDSVSTYGLPNNPISGARYQGVNLLRLLIASAVGKYEDSRWMTLKQANKQGYRIKKGAKSVLLEKWVWSKIVEEENENGELEKKIVKLRNPYVNFFRVFNAEQIDGIGPIPKVIPMEKNEMLKLAEEVIASSQCEIVESMQNRAYYSPKEDKIMLPPRDYFKSQEAFLAVTLHEMSHSTGHPDRLNRPIVNKFGTPEYAKEELNAEFALKAKTDIVNSKGENIFKKGDTIATTTSQDDQFEYLEFIGLPTDIYAKDGTGCEMYEGEEVYAPAG